MRRPVPALLAVSLAAALGAAHAQTLGGASGPAGDAAQVEKCDAPKGTLAVVEPQSQVLQSLQTMGLGSPSGMIRLIIQQSDSTPGAVIPDGDGRLLVQCGDLPLEIVQWDPLETAATPEEVA